MPPMQKPITPTRSQRVASAAAAASPSTRASSSEPPSARRSGDGSRSRPGHSSNAHTVQPCSSASLATSPSNSGRRPPMSGTTTRPRDGSPPAGRPISAAVPDGKAMRIPAFYTNPSSRRLAYRTGGRSPRAPAGVWGAEALRRSPPPSLEPGGARGGRVSLPPLASAVPVEDARLRETREAFLDGPRPAPADARDLVEIIDRGPHDFLQAPEAAHDPIDHRLRQARDAREQPVATRLHVGVEVDRGAG